MRGCFSRERLLSFLCVSLSAAAAASCGSSGNNISGGAGGLSSSGPGATGSSTGAASGTGAATGTASGAQATTSSSGGAGQCTPCLSTPACGSGSDCAQFAGDTYCAVDCSSGGACPSGTTCTGVNTTEGHAVSVCVPVTNPCGGRMSGSSSTATATSTTTGSSGGTCAHSPCTAGAALTTACDPCAAAVCMGDAYCCNNKWDAQCVSEAMSACGASCAGGATSATSTSSATTSTSTSSGGTCAHSPCATGAALTSGCDACATTVCAGDSYCCNNKWDAQCVTQAESACGSSCSGGTSTSTSTSTTTSTASSSSTSSTSSSSTGGPLSTLSFAVVGDTRPANTNDTSGYPTAIITQIWKDVEAQSPRPAFAVTTGDYMFADPTSGTAGPQLQLYLAARSNFSNTVYPAMGNHECTGYTASNCGPGNKDGVTDNYTQFMTKMLGPINQNNPYYTMNVSGGTWTAKFVFIACNAWNGTQASWLASELSKSTTYTFVVRHEGTTATTAPCLAGSGSMNADTIISQHPYTLLIAGHTHTYAYYSSEKQVIVGNGGAPITGSVDYGYVVARQQTNGSILFTEYDYKTNAATSSFSVQ